MGPDFVATEANISGNLYAILIISHLASVLYVTDLEKRKKKSLNLRKMSFSILAKVREEQICFTLIPLIIYVFHIHALCIVVLVKS